MSLTLRHLLRGLLLLGLLLQGVSGSWAASCAHAQASAEDEQAAHAHHAQHTTVPASAPDSCDCGCDCLHPCALSAAKVLPAPMLRLELGATSHPAQLASPPRVPDPGASPPLRPPIRT